MRAILFFLFPIVEFYLLIRVGAEVGALTVVAWCIATACVGAWILKGHSLEVLRGMQADMRNGISPQESMLSVLLVFCAGLLLIFPGFISDAIGFLLLLPPVRQAAAKAFTGYAAAQQARGRAQFFFIKNQSPFGGGFSRKEEYTTFDVQQEPRQATVIECTPVDTASSQHRAAGAVNTEKEQTVFDCDPENSEDPDKKHPS